jgi:hypothetical protein
MVNWLPKIIFWDCFNKVVWTFLESSSVTIKIYLAMQSDNSDTLSGCREFALNLINTFLNPEDFSSCFTGQVIWSLKADHHRIVAICFFYYHMISLANWSLRLLSRSTKRRDQNFLWWWCRSWPNTTLCSSATCLTLSSPVPASCACWLAVRAPACTAVRNNKVSHRFTALEWKLAEQ